MSAGSDKFLEIVLGQDGAKALTKAIERAPILSSVLVPRTIVSWLETAVRLQYEGEIPGLDNSYISLNKTEETFSGALTVADNVHSFDRADLLHVAAAIGVSLGISGQGLDPQLRGQDLSKLGKSIDLLVRARVVIEALRHQELTKTVIPFKPRTESPVCGFCDAEAPLVATMNVPGSLAVIPKEYRVCATCHANKWPPTALLQDAPVVPINKVELPGKAAAPGAPKAPTPPDGQKKQPAMSAKPTFGKKELKVTKAEAERKCWECGGQQFVGDKLIGCLCFRGLLKSSKVQTTATADGTYVVKFIGYDWDAESVQALISVFKG